MIEAVHYSGGNISPGFMFAIVIIIAVMVFNGRFRR